MSALHVPSIRCVFQPTPQRYRCIFEHARNSSLLLINRFLGSDQSMLGATKFWLAFAQHSLFFDPMPRNPVDIINEESMESHGPLRFATESTLILISVLMRSFKIIYFRSSPFSYLLPARVGMASSQQFSLRSKSWRTSLRAMCNKRLFLAVSFFFQRYPVCLI